MSFPREHVLRSLANMCVELRWLRDNQTLIECTDDEADICNMFDIAIDGIEELGFELVRLTK